MIRNGIGNIRNDAARRQLEVAAGVRREELNNQAAAMGQNMMAQAETLPSGILASSPELQQTAMAMANGGPVQRFANGNPVQAPSRQQRLTLPLPPFCYSVGHRPLKPEEQFGVEKVQNFGRRSITPANIELGLGSLDRRITESSPLLSNVRDVIGSAKRFGQRGADVLGRFGKTAYNIASEGTRYLGFDTPKFDIDPFFGQTEAEQFFDPAVTVNFREITRSPDDRLAEERGNVERIVSPSVIDPKAVKEADESVPAPLSPGATSLGVSTIPQQLDAELQQREPTARPLTSGLDAELQQREPTARPPISGDDATKISLGIRNEIEDPIDPDSAPGANPNEKVITEPRKNASRKEKGEAISRAAIDLLDLNRKDFISDSALNKSILSALGVETGKKTTPEEEVKKNMELYKKIFKEDPGKDKTIDGYNLAFLGFAIASGRSPNALSNIADGLLKGVKKFNDTEEKRQARERKAREFGLQKFLKDDEARKKFAQDFQLQERRLQARFAGIFSNEKIALAQMVTRAQIAQEQIASQEKIANDSNVSAEKRAAATLKVQKLRTQLQAIPESVRFADTVIGRLYPELEKGTDEHGSKFSQLVNQFQEGKSLRRNPVESTVFNIMNDRLKKEQFVAAYKKQNPGVKTVDDKDLVPFIANQIRSISRAARGVSTPSPTTGTAQFRYDPNNPNTLISNSQ